MNEIHTEVAIVGAGLIGGSAALALARAGVSVTLIERGVAGACASGVNFGGVRRQGRAPDQLTLAARAHEIWPHLRELIGIDGEYVRSGHMKLARTQGDLVKLAAYRQKVEGFGLDLEIVEGAEFRRRFPCFGAEVIGGSLCPEDGQANPRLVAPAFALAAERAGARLLQQCNLICFSHEGDAFVLKSADGRVIRASVLVNAAGAWGARIATAFGDEVPMRIKHPTMAVTEPLPPITSVSIGIEGGGFYARQVARGNVVMGGGFGEAVGEDVCRPGGAAMAALGRNAPAILPGLAHASIIRYWSGIEGYFDDKNPVLGHSTRQPGLIHAFGFSGAGFQISPAVGEVVADLARGRTSPLIDAAVFSPARFS
jgi:sarcosine oxidase subunit beta